MKTAYAAAATLAVALVVLVSWTPSPVAPVAPKSVQRFEDAVLVQRTISLEENDEVINVQPSVTEDPAGGFIVADASEGQVRLYSRQGRLVHYFGSPGPGPKEFKRLTAAVRLPSNEIAAFDMGGKIAYFDAAGRAVLRTQQTPLVPIYNVAVLDREHVVIAGRLRGKAETNLLHIWNTTTGAIDTSFLSVPPHPKELTSAYAFTGFVDVTVRQDGQIAALFSLSDSIYRFNKHGGRLRSIPIPFEGFRFLKTPLPADGPVDQMQAWLESFSAGSDIFWTSDGGFLVQYFDVKGNDQLWRLLRMDANGQRLFEFPGTPRLLAVSDSTLTFIKRHHPTPNQWSVAHLR